MMDFQRDQPFMPHNCRDFSIDPKPHHLGKKMVISCLGSPETTNNLGCNEDWWVVVTTTQIEKKKGAGQNWIMSSWHEFSACVCLFFSSSSSVLAGKSKVSVSFGFITYVCHLCIRVSYTYNCWFDLSSRSIIYIIYISHLNPSFSFSIHLPSKYVPRGKTGFVA